MRKCVTLNELWTWPIFSGSFSHEFAIKLLKYGISCRVRSTASSVLDGLFPYSAHMIISIGGCVMHNDLWHRPISSKSFNHDFVIKLLQYRTSCRVWSIASTVLFEFFSYFAHMITRGCVMPNDLWSRYISLWSFIHDFVIKLLKLGTS